MKSASDAQRNQVRRKHLIYAHSHGMVCTWAGKPVETKGKTMTKRNRLAPEFAALMTIETCGGVTHLRRYVRGPHGRLTCSHEGDYSPQSVTPHGVFLYLERGANQDRRAA